MSKCYVLCVEDPCNKQHYSQVAEVRLPVAPTYVRDAVATIHRSNDCAASSVNVVDEPAAADPGAVTLVQQSLHVASSNPHLDGEQPIAVTLRQQSLNVASSNTHLDGEQPSAVTLVQQSLNVASSNPHLGEQPSAVTVRQQSLNVASSNPHLGGEQPSAVTVRQQSLNVASSNPHLGGEQPSAVTVRQQSLNVASSNPHLDGEQPSAVTLVQQSLNVASSSPQPTTSRDNSICTPRMPGSLSDKLHYIMQAVDRLEATQNRILQSLESAGIPSNSSESAAEFDMGSKTLPVGSEDDMDHLSQLLENRNKRRQLVRQLFLTRY